MKKKIDFTKMNDFLIAHGEKIALGVCLLLGGFLGFSALSNAMNAGMADGGKPWYVVFQDYASNVMKGMSSAKPEPLPEATEAMMKPESYDWKPMHLKYDQRPYQPVPDNQPNQRRTPNVMPIKNGPNDFHLAYLRGLILKYETNATKDTKILVTETDKDAPELPKKKGDVQYRFKHVGVPTRMVVVTARFPMAEQVKEFQNAFRMADQKTLLSSPDDLPHPLGFNVYRAEVTADGKSVIGDPELLMVWDKNDEKVRLAPSLDKLLREAVFDDATPDKLESYLWAGLTMPMPKFASGSAHYPGIYFEGMEVSLDEEKGKTKPGKGKVVDKEKGPIVVPGKKNPKDPKIKDPNAGVRTPQEFKEEDVSLKKLRASDSRLALRLSENDYNPYHVLGHKPKPPAEAAAGGNLTNEGKVPPKPGEKGRANNDGRFFSAWDKKPTVKPKVEDGEDAPKEDPKKPSNWESDAIVRFIDVDVQPGKTYAYSIQIRMANPNFGKEKLVAYASLAAFPELPPTPWVTTPSITIPPEYFMYAIDQQKMDDWAANKKPAVIDQKQYKEMRDYAALQLHQWVPKGPDPDAAGEEVGIGDWVVMERQLVRRGEPIGRDVITPVPVWRPLKDGFDLPMVPTDKKEQEKDKDKKFKPGMKINFGVAPEPPVLIDFVGGAKGVQGRTPDEEVAVEALILNPDGSLSVLNSREAIGDWQPDVPTPVRRIDRVLHVRQRVEDATRQENPKDKKGPPLPLPKK